MSSGNKKAKTPEELAWSLWDMELGSRIDFIPAATAMFTEAIHQAKKEAFEEAAVLAEHRAHELMTVYKMHNGLPDIRGSVGAGEVGILIRKLKEKLSFIKYECCGSTTQHYHSVSCPKAR